jgi:SAM-dependent methyltransferase
MFEQLVAEAVAAPLRGWDFGFQAGRVAGSDPSWSYPEIAAPLVRHCRRLLDLDTGGGEMLASLGPLPPGSIATEGWEPNLEVARQRLGIDVRFAPDATLPVDDEAVDLVLCRHGRLDATEVTRVLSPGGTLLTQQVGSDDCAEINTALGAPPAYPDVRNATTMNLNGLTITDVREEWPLFRFFDIGALIFQLRAVPWQVRDFTVERYEEPLRRIDAQIHADGEFRVRSHRFLIAATKGSR